MGVKPHLLEWTNATELVWMEQLTHTSFNTQERGGKKIKKRKFTETKWKEKDEIVENPYKAWELPF